MAKLKIVDEGIVSRRQPGSATAVCGGSRCVVLSDGQIVCTFMVQQALGINDCKPVLVRSHDGGRTWGEEEYLWPDQTKHFSLFGSISRSSTSDELIFYAMRCRIDRAGEPNWSEATSGLKQNDLCWARSTDGGRTWSPLNAIPMPIAGSAEAPGPICIMRSGRWACCYAPYNTFDPNLKVDRNQLAGMFSNDQGKTWKYQPIMRFPQATAGAAEAWVVQLSDGRLLSTCWHIDHANAADFPNPYALSEDEGHTWQGPFSTGIQGQSTGLMPLPDGRAVMVFNQRKQDPIGVHLAVARPTTTGFNIEQCEPIWRAQVATQSDTSAAHDNWKDYAFGEPAATLLPDGDILVVMWCLQPGLNGIRWVRVRV